LRPSTDDLGTGAEQDLMERAEPTVVTTVSDGVADVCLNRPGSLNAVDDAMFAAIIETAARLRDDGALRAVVLRGAGRAFCSGLDMRAFQVMREAGSDWRPADADAAAAAIADVGGLTLGRAQRAVLIWQTIPVPVIAAVHGVAVGLGLQLALGADIRLVAPEARLGALEITWGLAPDSGGTQLLPRLIGPDRAMDLCATGRLVSGREAAEIGLATRLADDPRAAALELAGHIAARNPEAIRSVARLVRMGATGSWQDGLIAEREEMSKNVGSANQREAVAAVMEKRPPVFTDASRARGSS
jgi:enoyl-CoA hydratase/carnithine racemase